MCGIAGIANLNGLSAAEHDALSPMVKSLQHRGPDGSGIHFQEMAALGHSRLSIIDVAAGKQPMCNEDGSLWITFNGETYNFLDLHQQPVAKGHVFKTRSDTETILHLYEEAGERCVDQLQGMFALAIWDDNRQQLFLARDRLCIKPLYYMPVHRRLIFGSEIKAILEAPGVSRDINFEALLDYLTFLFIPQPKSIYRGIFKLPPAHTATFGREVLRLREYWRLHYPEPAERSLAQWTEAFRQQLRAAVSSHLISDVPLGAFLSGGLDSSAVVALMAQLDPNRPITNSIGFQEQPFNELEHANCIAAKFHTRHHSHVVAPDATEVVNRLAWHYDEPFADSSAIPTYYVSK